MDWRAAVVHHDTLARDSVLSESNTTTCNLLSQCESTIKRAALQLC